MSWLTFQEYRQFVSNRRMEYHPVTSKYADVRICTKIYVDVRRRTKMYEDVRICTKMKHESKPTDEFTFLTDLNSLHTHLKKVHTTKVTVPMLEFLFRRHHVVTVDLIFLFYRFTERRLVCNS